MSLPRIDSASLIDSPDGQISVDKVVTSLHDMNLHTKAPSLIVNGSLATLELPQPSISSRESGSDDSQRVDSCSEFGTKPPSLDGKSITSGTTFALDEKESLRPDDSASVKAAGEDDDSTSIRGSFVASSRIDPEVALRGRLVLPDRRVVHQSGPSAAGAMTPQSASSEQPLEVNGDTSSDALNLIYRQAPDEKLLEALASPRDQYFLLRLEKDVIDFVQNSKEPYMDLPPSNSFCRMLTHKLADYYHMTHSFEPQIGAVRIFRTPFCRVPPSLALMSPPTDVSTSITPPLVVQPRKIMRRGQDSDAHAPPGAFGAASETGSDAKDGKGKDSTPNQKLTREEREEMYKAARERIFGSSEDPSTDHDLDHSMSRTSSMSANRPGYRRGKSNGQRRDDGVDSRHQYSPYWNTQHQPWVSQQQVLPEFGSPSPHHYGGQVQVQYPAQMNSVYSDPNQGQVSPHGLSAAHYPSMPMPQFAPPSQSQYPPAGSPMPVYGLPAQGPAPAAGWQQPYHTSAPSTPSRGQGHADRIPYAFGQLPANLNSGDLKSQHPIPGSYNRNHSFNPKTQSFIPGVHQMTPALPQPPFTATSSHHGSPQIMQPHLAYPGYQQSQSTPYGGYGMARQGSSNSIGSFHGSPRLPPHIPSHMQHTIPPNPHMTLPSHQSHSLSQHYPVHRLNHNTGSSQAYGNLPTYGNPATLPQKPNIGV